MLLPWSVALSSERSTSNQCAGWAEGWSPWFLISSHQPSSQCCSPHPLHETAAMVTMKWVTPSAYPLYTLIWFPLWLLILGVAWIQLSPPLLAPHINNHPQTAPAAFLPHLFPSRLLVLISLLFHHNFLSSHVFCLSSADGTGLW